MSAEGEEPPTRLVYTHVVVLCSKIGYRRWYLRMLEGAQSYV